MRFGKLLKSMTAMLTLLTMLLALLPLQGFAADDTENEAIAATNTPIYNSAYIEGIGNLYEFDCGELSGWMYKVNGWFPNYGCSRYRLKSGDRVEWVYTCDLGRDVGGYYSTGNGKREE